MFMLMWSTSLGTDGRAESYIRRDFGQCTVFLLCYSVAPWEIWHLKRSHSWQVCIFSKFPLLLSLLSVITLHRLHKLPTFNVGYVLFMKRDFPASYACSPPQSPTFIVLACNRGPTKPIYVATVIVNVTSIPTSSTTSNRAFQCCKC